MKINIIDLIVFVLISSFSVFLLLNINYFTVPNPDIFQYIDDGKEYASFTFPLNIQQHPANPILINILTNFVSNYKYSDILAAHLINIFSALIILIFSYLILREYSYLMGFIVNLFLVTLPLFVFQALDVTSEVLFAAVVMITFYAYKKNKTLAYVFSGISFLVRFEGVILFLAMIFWDFLDKRNVRNLIKNCGFGFLIISLWLIIMNRNNLQGNIWGNTYIQEVVTLKHQIPQIGIVLDLPNSLISNFPNSVPYQMLFYSILFVSVGWLLIKLSDPLWKIVFLFIGGYIFSHYFFPFAPHRYIYPILWGILIAPLLGITDIIRKISLPILFKRSIYLLLSLIFLRIVLENIFHLKLLYTNTTSIHKAYPRYQRYEERLAANWLDDNLQTDTIVITYNPWIMDYFSINKNIKFLYLPYEDYQQCDSILCLVDSKIQNKEQNIIFVKKQYSFFEDERFPSAANFNVKIFNNFPSEKEKEKFVLLEKISFQDIWLEIYLYQGKKLLYEMPET